jgi:hypothetical protein
MLTKSIEKEMKSLKQPFSTIVVTNSDNFNDTVISLIKSLGSDSNVVFVSFNKPSSVLEKTFGDKLKCNIFYIDLVTQVATGEVQKKKNIVFLVSQRNLTDLSITLSEVLNRINGKKFVFIDSLTTMLLYNDVNNTSQFLQFLSNRLKLWNTNSFIFSMEGKDENEVIRVASQTVDKVIKI